MDAVIYGDDTTSSGGEFSDRVEASTDGIKAMFP